MPENEEYQVELRLILKFKKDFFIENTKLNTPKGSENLAKDSTKNSEWIKWYKQYKECEIFKQNVINNIKLEKEEYKMTEMNFLCTYDHKTLSGILGDTLDEIISKVNFLIENGDYGIICIQSLIVHCKRCENKQKIHIGISIHTMDPFWQSYIRKCLCEREEDPKFHKIVRENECKFCKTG